MMSQLINDLRYAARSFAKTPVTVLVIVISLGLGIGATTAVFTISNALLFRSSSVLGDSENVVSVYTSDADGELYGGNSFPDYLSILEGVPAIAEAAAIRAGAVTLGERGGSRPLFSEIVTGNYFSVLGIRMAKGRSFLPEETDLENAARVAVISSRLWRDQFGDATWAAGKTLSLDGHEFTVVGVAPEGLVNRMLSIRIDVWVPLGIPGGTFRATPEAMRNRGDRDFMIVGRLADSGSLERARTQLAVLAGRLHAGYHAEWDDERGNSRILSLVTDEESRMSPRMKQAFGVMAAMMMAVAGMILLIACTNVAGVFIARAGSRRREMAVRVSLGASRSRLLAMLMTESILPALVGGGLGVLFAVWLTGSVDSLQTPMGVPIEFDFSTDRRVLAFALVVSLGSSVIFGLLPALGASRPDLVPSLKGVTTMRGRRVRALGLRNLLVVGQVASSLVLLIGAGLAIRTMQGVSSLDLGFSVDRIAVQSKRLAAGGGADPEAIVRYVRELRARLGALPDVADVHVTRSAEATFLAGLSSGEVHVDNRTDETVAGPLVLQNSVTPGYLEMLGVRLLRGRAITSSDVAGSTPVAVVTRSFAEQFWPGDPALGRRFTVVNRREGEDLTGGPEVTYEVVGVVADGRYAGIGRESDPYFWAALYQDPPENALIHLRGHTDAAEMVSVLRREIELEENEVLLVTPTSLEELASFGATAYRKAGEVLAAGGVFGLALVAVGIYGIVSLAVAERAREMAIRQAVGACGRQVVVTVAREALVLAMVGSLVGVAIIVPVARLGETAVYGIAPLDPYAFGVGVGVLAVTTLAASVIPARRVLKAQPMAVLREE